MEADRPPIRKIPLKIAGVFGFFNAAVYLAVIIGADDSSAVPQAIFWLGLMILAGILAWFADTVPGRERMMAIASTFIYFTLAMFSSALFALIYLAATAMAAYGWAWMKKKTPEKSAASS